MMMRREKTVKAIFKKLELFIRFHFIADKRRDFDGFSKALSLPSSFSFL
jgi:hypothetical protein